MEGFSQTPACTTATRRGGNGAKGGAVQRLAIVSLALCAPMASGFLAPPRQQCASTYVLPSSRVGGAGVGRQASLTRRRSVMPEAPPTEKRGVRGAKTAE